MRTVLLLLALVGCATINGSFTLRPSWWTEEEHGGASGRPAVAPDVAFVAAGAGFDAGLQALKVPFVPRFLADITVAVGVRNLKPFGRSEGSGFFLLYGSTIATLVGETLRHLHRAP